MSAWLFDLGNTRLKCAPLAGGGAGPAVALPHGEGEWPAALAAVLPERLEVAYVASVAGDALRVALLQALAQRAGRIELARTSSVFAGLRIAYAQPQKLGVDRFLAMLAACRRWREPVLVCGIGTALTIDLVDADGRHLGGRIAPSPGLMRDVLHARAPQLPAEGGAYDEFGMDTEDALASGCDGAALALVERSRAAALARLGRDARLLLHGGGADGLVQRLPGAILEPALVLEGLAAWATSHPPA